MLRNHRSQTGIYSKNQTDDPDRTNGPTDIPVFNLSDHQLLGPSLNVKKCTEERKSSCPIEAKHIFIFLIFGRAYIAAVLFLFFR